MREDAPTSTSPISASEKERDPRLDPRPGDKLDLIGWDIEVIGVNEKWVDYWQRPSYGKLFVASEMVHKTPVQWRETMGKHATVVKVAS